ncbi:ABC transporter substrate-binding protein [Acidisoma cladoniae]|uniref:ABC transporter substrate-binding protein n=1 Tax=Acidisoma cladoniae TaxID=3040935 RepID=UPI002549C544|nr:ABC transporter substrate-binding protein [Acidisoma sp. PAMC 29798]
MTRSSTLLAATFLAALPILSAQAGAPDTLSVGIPLEPPGLDPTAGAASAIREVTLANIYQGLTRIDAAGTVIPDLAKSWTVSPDGLTYNFALQSGVTFHDGTVFDCSIVKFSYGRAAAPDSINAQKELFEPIAKVDCPSPLAAVITLKRPTSTFLYGMAWGDAVMVAPNSAGGNKAHPIGTGPFTFSRWVPGDRIELVRNPHYWGPAPKLSGVTFRVIADPAAATAALLSGALDAYPDFPAPETVDKFRHDSRFTVDIGTTEGKVILALNNARKPFNDVRVRRALAYAIDRKALIDATYSGLGTPIGSHYTPQDPSYIDLSKTYPYDPAKAKQLLSEAGVGPGLTMTIILPPPSYAQRGGELIAAYLQQVGINAKLESVEWPKWLSQVFTQSAFDATVIEHDEAHDLDIYARPKYYFNYDSPAYKAFYAQYIAATDAATQADLLQKMQRQLATDEPNVFLFAFPKIGIWNAHLRGLWSNAPMPMNDVTGVSWAP